ncbi:prepilin peptidase [Vibrio tapetis]|uniref:Putative Flp operon protein B n=1 Tax=Vibrio tapetis subsp. tapetis TaxID=1671868 RepID=A0A2N8ZJ16_9VIBR|nr:prepilin peptidase [Vibrio tapetis]SON51892.1 putative Flp operon protein B [Vibrio tapetis subsp. tapetis]
MTVVIFLSILTVLAVNICISDWKERLISNKLVALNFAVCLFIALLLDVSPIWQGLVISLITFVIGLFLFKYKVFGAGDIKLLMGYSLCFDFSLALNNLIGFLLVGGVVVMFQFGWAYLTAGYQELKERGVPYGIAIASVSTFNIVCLVLDPSNL